MKFKGVLVMLLAGLVSLPFTGFGDLSAVRQAAERGDITAQRGLGGMYATGVGVPKNTAEAVKWYLRAAEQGDGQAQLLVGKLLVNLQDYAQAYAWLTVAAENGVFFAATYRSAVVHDMTPAQIAEGEQLSKELLKKYLK